MKNYSIGIDIGGTNTVLGIVDQDGNIIYKHSILTNQFQTINLFIDKLYDLLMPVINEIGGVENIKGIGIGAPNGNYYTGTIEYAPNLPWKGIIKLTELLSSKFKLLTFLTNDANAAAMGEMMYGAAKDMKDFIMITLGTGVGSGIVCNGKLVYGYDGFAGELGHTIIIPNGRIHPATGSKGSLEMYASARGLCITATELLKNNPTQSSILRNISIDKLESKDIYECALMGDSIAIETFEYTGKILGMALANFIMFSSPEAIILFGGPTKAGDILLTPIRKHIEENLFPIYKNKVKLLFSSLRENDAAILGAAALALEKTHHKV